jgi:hypothetical protein
VATGMLMMVATVAMAMVGVVIMVIMRGMLMMVATVAMGVHIYGGF